MAMMNAAILSADVVHHRLFPSDNKFIYKIYYLSLPLRLLEQGSLDISLNKWGLQSFYFKDHGYRDSRLPSTWARDVLRHFNLDTVANGEIILITMPRVFGFVFNPVSFYLCYDSEQHLRAMIYEVNNTFGESHSYITFDDHHGIITPDMELSTQKVFHVSPFLEREGHYSFRIKNTDQSFGVWIDYFDAAGRKKLLTSLIGKRTELSQDNLKKTLQSMPFVTLKAVLLIHWQAVILLLKKIRYIPKPKQHNVKITR